MIALAAALLAMTLGLVGRAVVSSPALFLLGNFLF